MVIKVENNLTEILQYLEVLNYTWNSGEKPTKYMLSKSCSCLIIRNNCITFGIAKEGVSFEEFKKHNPIQKKHLRPGMIVEYVSGERRLVANIMGELVLISEDGFQTLSEYNEDLTIDDCPNVTIDKIGLSCPRSLDVMLDIATIIWERPKPVTEVTLQEITEKFNISVEQLKIKK